MGKKADVPFKEVFFKQTIKESIEIYSPGLLYAMAIKEAAPSTKPADSTMDTTKEESDKQYIMSNAILENSAIESDTSKEADDNEITNEDTILKAETPTVVYLEEQLKKPLFIKQTFYNEDASTYIFDDQLDYDKLMGFDASMKQTDEKPQILIYHTHSQESYMDSKAGDVSTSIVGVGEYLADILQDKYGFNVIHHLGQYDIESRDYAYSRAMEGISKVLDDNPSIEVIIDLHRDETNSETKLVTTIQDKEMARFMFFNGLCYTRELGKLENLQNPYIQENLAIAFQMQLFADEYYPGLTRRIYLKGYRYNMHFRPKSLLIELGSQTNTVAEAKNSCEPLAHIISSVLKGENK
jgi:stage II sporulation protein P